MGLIKGKKDKPLKLKVELSTQLEQKRLTTAAVRQRLRDDEVQEAFPDVYISPSRTRDQRHKLWLLRCRRNELNDKIERDGNKWILDSVRYRLWKKKAGVVLHDVYDGGFKEGARAHEAAHPRPDQPSAFPPTPTRPPRRSDSPGPYTPNQLANLNHNATFQASTPAQPTSPNPDFQ